MSESFDAGKFAGRCAGIVESCANEHHNILVDEYADAVSNSRLGDKIPSPPQDGDTIRTQEGLERFAETRRGLVDRLAYEAQEAREAYMEAVGTPSEDALRSIQLLSMKPKVTYDDVDRAVKRYGDQLDAFSAIKGIAQKSGVPFYHAHPLEHVGRIIDSLEARTANYIDQPWTSETGVNITKAQLADIASNRDAMGRQLYS